MNVKKTNITSTEYKEFLSTDEDDLRIQTQESENDYKFLNDEIDKDVVEAIAEKSEEQEENENGTLETGHDEVSQANKNIARIMEQITSNEEENKIEE